MHLGISASQVTMSHNQCILGLNWQTRTTSRYSIQTWLVWKLLSGVVLGWWLTFHKDKKNRREHALRNASCLSCQHSSYTVITVHILWFRTQVTVSMEILQLTSWFFNTSLLVCSGDTSNYSSRNEIISQPPAHNQTPTQTLWLQMRIHFSAFYFLNPIFQ